MAKMNLDFLLSPDSNSSNRRQGSGESSSRGDSAFSLDYIAPRHNTSDQGRPRQHQRRSSEQNTQIRAPAAGPSRPVPRDQGGQSSKPNFKKKGRTPTSPATQRPPSSSAEVKPHVCRHCERSFYKLEQLKRHDRLVHQNLRPFVCTTCDLSFGTKQNMQVHLTTRKHRHRLQTLQSSGHSSYAGSSRQKH
eukprot:GFKZ01000515.1.p1 GENE.GFKZ01000515.1~~GFKZ01000515.1.p1  ORF type:complete len:191 (-),score=4.75 GFKZ01000515.1:66-638(-)